MAPGAAQRPGDLALQLLRQRRFQQLQRAVERGLVDPHCEINESHQLVYASAAHGAVGLVRYLIRERGADPNAQESGTRARPLHVAIERKHSRVITFLLDEAPGIDLNVTD